MTIYQWYLPLAHLNLKMCHPYIFRFRFREIIFGGNDSVTELKYDSRGNTTVVTPPEQNPEREIYTK